MAKLKHFVYVLRSQIDNSTYVDYTTDILKRLEEHNRGQSNYTKAKRPWTIEWYCAFEKKDKAKGFEVYLKSGSGRAFSRKRLI